VTTTGVDDSTYSHTALEAADVTDGSNAAVLCTGVRGKFASFLDQTFTRGHLERIVWNSSTGGPGPPTSCTWRTGTSGGAIADIIPGVGAERLVGLIPITGGRTRSGDERARKRSH
jgi:hypothetical protein